MIIDPKEMVRRLRVIVDDPMWTDHVEVSKAVILLTADALASLVAERDEARELVTEANNSLYGSQGYFHSLDGGPFDKRHLSNGIEKLKSYSRTQRARAESAEAERDALREALARRPGPSVILRRRRLD